MNNKNKVVVKITNVRLIADSDVKRWLRDLRKRLNGPHQSMSNEEFKQWLKRRRL